jgi:DNA-directed RNA polymerase subunit RPC12/RpoP
VRMTLLTLSSPIRCTRCAMRDLTKPRFAE